MRGLIQILLLVSSLALALPAMAAPKPFELREGQVVIKVTLNGREVPALLDTGATRSLIATDLARELGIRVQKFNGGTVGTSGGRVGYGMTERKIAVDFGLGVVSKRLGIYDARHTFAADGVRFLIGMDFLYALVVSLDFERMTIDFQRSAEFSAPKD